MTPDEFRRIRLKIGLTQRQLADLLGYAHYQRVLEFERSYFTSGGARYHPVPPLLERLMRAYAEGYRPRDWPKA